MANLAKYGFRCKGKTYVTYDRFFIAAWYIFYGDRYEPNSIQVLFDGDETNTAQKKADVERVFMSLGTTDLQDPKIALQLEQHLRSILDR